MYNRGSGYNGLVNLNAHSAGNQYYPQIPIFSDTKYGDYFLMF